MTASLAACEGAWQNTLGPPTSKSRCQYCCLVGDSQRLILLALAAKPPRHQYGNLFLLKSLLAIKASLPSGIRVSGTFPQRQPALFNQRAVRDLQLMRWSFWTWSLASSVDNVPPRRSMSHVSLILSCFQFLPFSRVNEAHPTKSLCQLWDP